MAQLSPYERIFGELKGTRKSREKEEAAQEKRDNRLADLAKRNAMDIAKQESDLRYSTAERARQSESTEAGFQRGQQEMRDKNQLALALLADTPGLDKNQALVDAATQISRNKFNPDIARATTAQFDTTRTNAMMPRGTEYGEADINSKIAGARADASSSDLLGLGNRARMDTVSDLVTSADRANTARNKEELLSGIPALNKQNQAAGQQALLNYSTATAQMASHPESVVSGEKAQTAEAQNKEAYARALADQQQKLAQSAADTSLAGDEAVKSAAKLSLRKDIGQRNLLKHKEDFEREKAIAEANTYSLIGLDPRLSNLINPLNTVPTQSQAQGWRYLNKNKPMPGSQPFSQEERPPVVDESVPENPLLAPTTATPAIQNPVRRPIVQRSRVSGMRPTGEIIDLLNK